MRSHLLLLTCLLLVSCAAPTLQPDEDAYGTLETLGEGALRVAVITDSVPVGGDLGLTKNTTSVVLSGSKTDRILIEESETDGTVMFDSLTKDLLPRDVIAAWWSYYAGGGTLVALRRDGNVLRIEKREFDEQSGCGEWELLKAYRAQTSTAVSTSPSQNPISDVSIAYCDLD